MKSLQDYIRDLALIHVSNSQMYYMNRSPEDIRADLMTNYDYSYEIEVIGMNTGTNVAETSISFQLFKENFTNAVLDVCASYY